VEEDQVKERDDKGEEEVWGRSEGMERDGGMRLLEQRVIH